MHAPFEMILTASSVLSALSVNKALNLLCRGTLPEVLSRVASRADKVLRSISATMVRERAKIRD